MTKATSILIGSIAVLVAGVALVGIGVIAERTEVWQLGALLLLGGAGALGVKGKLSGKVAKIILIGAALLSLGGCRIYVGSKGNWSWTIGATHVEANILGQTLHWVNEPPDREGSPTTKPSN